MSTNETTCACGEPLVRALRYGDDAGPASVWACFAGSDACVPPEPRPARQRRMRWCDHCGGPLQTGLRYCSPSCYGAAKRGPVSVLACEQCGARVTVTAYQQANGRGRYCSTACSATSRRRHTGAVQAQLRSA